MGEGTNHGEGHTFSTQDFGKGEGFILCTEKPGPRADQESDLDPLKESLVSYPKKHQSPKLRY